MGTKAIVLTLLSLSFSCESLIAAQKDEVESTSGTVPLSWQQAADSWGMDLKAYIAEGDKLLDENDSKASHTRISYDDLVPLLNPYANLAPAVKVELMRSLGTQAAYDDFIREQQRSFPKFTIAR